MGDNSETESKTKLGDKLNTWIQPWTPFATWRGAAFALFMAIIGIAIGRCQTYVDTKIVNNINADETLIKEVRKLQKTSYFVNELLEESSIDPQDSLNEAISQLIDVQKAYHEDDWKQHFEITKGKTHKNERTKQDWEIEKLKKIVTTYHQSDYALISFQTEESDVFQKMGNMAQTSFDNYPAALLTLVDVPKSDHVEISNLIGLTDKLVFTKNSISEMDHYAYIDISSDEFKSLINKYANSEFHQLAKLRDEKSGFLVPQTASAKAVSGCFKFEAGLTTTLNNSELCNKLSNQMITVARARAVSQLQQPNICRENLYRFVGKEIDTDPCIMEKGAFASNDCQRSIEAYKRKLISTQALDLDTHRRSLLQRCLKEVKAQDQTTQEQINNPENFRPSRILMRK